MKHITRQDAKRQGLIYYYTGLICKHGHDSKRIVRNGGCVECRRVADRQRKRSRVDRETEAAYRRSRPDIAMYHRAQRRANKKGIPFTISINDIIIPTHCPIFGIELKVNEGGKHGSPNSPALDRINPELGYVPGNVQVISNRANTIKNDATLAELELIVEFLKECHA